MFNRFLDLFLEMNFYLINVKLNFMSSGMCLVLDSWILNSVEYEESYKDCLRTKG